MENRHEQKTTGGKEFFIGVMIGGLVGAAAALLWAPKSGRELRSNINDQAQIAKEKGEKLAESAKQKTIVLIDKVKKAGFPQTDEIIEDIENEVQYIPLNGQGGNFQSDVVQDETAATSEQEEASIEDDKINQ
ncbi:YtxH domain-containing protein [Calidifontibacillus erzurumensis]|uniref:YtxH domain-containing protein n=1 Tax=Calidifontibacillus erzurumensis TaxID=2741433 RepID=A0A8J8KAX7_9BACI|nr:YtxH domain-containing protein [Calidifontibacillus erzurumensis]NSL51324.1 YtxH domain-containing protein [Calidifontibacillus erzurumensis]